MDKIIKFLKSLGLSDQEIKKVLKEVPVDQSGLAGTNVAKGIFEKGGKEASADYPLITETMVSPFKLDKYKGLSRKETLEKADEALNFLDKELTRTSNLILNQNLQLSPEQKINFANNLRMKKQFEKDLEIFKTVPEAEVIKFETKQPISKEGIQQLTKESGQINPPGTLTGDIETRINRLKAMGEKKGMNLGEILKETGEAQLKYAAGDDVGLVRSVARQIMFNDIKSGKLKAPKEIQDIVSGASNIDVIEPFRTIYGENALEQLDSLIPDFKKTATEIDAEKLARSKYEFTPNLNRPKESYTTEEMEKILKGEEPPEKKANGGRIGYAEGTSSRGLDYLTGMEPSKGYATDGMVERENYALGSFLKKFIGTFKDAMNQLPQSTTPVAPEVPLTVQERYNKYLSEAENTTTSNSSSPIGELVGRVIKGVGISTPQGSTSANDFLYNLYKKNVEGKADGGRIGYADGSNDAPSITLDSYKDGRLGPEDRISKYKSYSELELLGNIDAKKPNYETGEEYIYKNMPVYEPKDVIPKGAVPTMPSKEYLRRRHQLDLAKGGSVGLGYLVGE